MYFDRIGQRHPCSGLPLRTLEQERSGETAFTAGIQFIPHQTLACNTSSLDILLQAFRGVYPIFSFKASCIKLISYRKH